MRPASTLAPPLLAFVFALASGMPGARGEGLPHLEVSRTPAAADCPDAEALAARVASTMKHPALDPASRPRDGAGFDVRLDRGAAGYQAVVQADGRLRVIDDPGADCTGLADALAITLAILLDEDAPKPAAARPPLEPPKAMEPARVASPAPASPRPPRFAIPPTPRLQLVAVALVSDGLTWPGALGFDVRARLHLDERFRLEVSLLDVPSKAEAPPFGGTVRVELVAGGFAGCARILGSHAGLSLDGCAELALGTLTGIGDGFVQNGKQVRTWGAASLAATLGGRIAGPVGWSARGAGVLPFSREQFDVDGASTPAFKAAPVGGLLGVGLGVTIW